MRFITGVAFGIALTIGGAYVHDQRAFQANQAPQPEAAVREGQIVNWEVLASFTKAKVAAVRRAFNTLVAP
jgi:hypothetical protein